MPYCNAYPASADWQQCRGTNAQHRSKSWELYWSCEVA